MHARKRELERQRSRTLLEASSSEKELPGIAQKLRPGLSGEVSSLTVRVIW